MKYFVDRVARLATGRPVVVLLLLAIATAVLGGLATQQDFDADLTAFTPEGELQELDERVQEEFGNGERQVQVIVDAGRGGNVLSPDGLAVAEAIEDATEEHDEIGDLLHAAGPAGGNGVITYAAPLQTQLQQMGMDASSATQSFIDAARDDALSGQQGEQITMLLSEDFDGAQARGGLVIIGLDPDVSMAEITDAHLTLVDVLDEIDTGFYDAEAFSFSIVQEEMEESMTAELPALLGAAFLFIVIFLAIQFRRTSDVIIGVLGLVASLVWMMGISVVLGPDYLGLTGPFTQIAMAVPVLLVALGIDYSIHLTSRYREERAGGARAVTAARTAVITVGVALSLATVTTVIGFMSNLTSPLPPIADFGVFAAVGIVAAAVVLGLLVPATRVLLDRRKEGRARAEGASTGPTDAPRELPGLSYLPARAPKATLLGGVLLAAVAGVAATALDTTFSQEEFIAEGSYADRMLTRLDTLFGGDISEQTDVLVDGDVRDPEVFELMLQAEEELADVEGVRSGDERADVTSPSSVVRELDQMADAAREQLSAQFAFLEDPDLAAEEVGFPDDLTYDDLPEDMREEIAEGDGELGEGELAGDEQLPVDDLDALEQRLPPGVSPTEALLSTLPGAQLVDTLREGVAEQLEQEAPEVDPAIISELADLEVQELTAAAIRDSGYPLDEVPEEAMDLLSASDELAELGWHDDGLATDADVAGILAVAAEHASEMLDQVLSETAALISVSTQAGEEGADQLAADMREVLEPLDQVVAGGIEVVSDQLMIDETLTQMTASQLEAIVTSLLAALGLMVLYYAIAARRPALGMITMLPPVLSVLLILGSMWAVGLTFNAMTATVSSIAIGIGVPYGIHITNRFLEERNRGTEASATITTTLRHTGTALVVSAVTTAGGFGVLLLSDLAPLQQFGGITSVTILYALITALLVESSALVLWDRWHRRRRGGPAETVGEQEAAAGAGADERVPSAQVSTATSRLGQQQEGPA